MQPLKQPAIMLLAALFASCYYDVEEELYANGNCDVPATVSFTLHVQTLINNQCAYSGCHVQGGSGNGDFTSYSGVKQKVDNGSFHQRVIVDRDMPPAAPLPDCDLQLLQAWLDQGAMN
jgi:hypothetical protein